jgi:hypothetical protein
LARGIATEYVALSAGKTPVRIFKRMHFRRDTILENGRIIMRTTNAPFQERAIHVTCHGKVDEVDCRPGLGLRIRSGSPDEFVTRHLDLTTSTSSFSYCSRFGFRYELWSSPVPDAADPPASSPSSHDRVQASQSPDLRRYIARLGFHASDSLSGRGWHCALKSARRCVPESSSAFC